MMVESSGCVVVGKCVGDNVVGRCVENNNYYNNTHVGGFWNCSAANYNSDNANSPNYFGPLDEDNCFGEFAFD